jgi:L-lactate utilization protein LutC
MSDARTEIFSRVHKALGRESLSSQQRKSLDERMASAPDLIRPQFSDDLVEHFANQLQSVAASFVRVSNTEGIIPAITEHLDSLGLNHKLVVAPSLKDLQWPKNFEIHSGRAREADLASVTGCFVAVAETGSVVLLSSPESPTTLNFLPDYHIAIVKSSQLVRHMEDVWTEFRQLPGGIPRTINLISGPSKTADVEQTLQVGAHGPRSFHVVFVEQS